MEYIIDGYNVIKSAYFKGRSESEKIVSFYNLLNKYRSKHPSVIFTIVFDGFRPSNFYLLKDRRLKTVFSGDITADEYIRKRVEKGKRNEEVIIVSNDKQVQISGKLFNCGISSVSKFIRIVSEERKRVKGVKQEKPSIDYRIKRKIEEELKRHYEKKY